jgi:transcription elongation factor
MVLMLMPGDRVKVTTGTHLGKVGVFVKTTLKMVVLRVTNGLEDIRVYQSSVVKISEKAERKTVVMTEGDTEYRDEAVMIRTIKEELRAVKDRVNQLTVLLARLEVSR